MATRHARLPATRGAVAARMLPTRLRLTKYNRAEPLSRKQVAGLLLDHIATVLYGGAAGGGKSSWLLHCAAQYFDVPGYSAVLFRRSFKQLEAAGALMDRSKLWWAGSDATWSENKFEWAFPTSVSSAPARLKFAYLDGKNDWQNHQGPEYQFVGFDELTQFRKWDVDYLWSRLRRPKPPEEWDPEDWANLPAEQQQKVAALSRVPLRMRVASNPGGFGHEWVKTDYGLYVPDGDDDPRRLCERPGWVREHERVFIPAKVLDNPGLDVDEYVKSLSHLDPTTLAQLMDGDWDAKEPGEHFRREWFPILDQAPTVTQAVRFWDLAATEPSQRNPDPDWTVGLKLGKTSLGPWVVTDVRRFRKRSEEVERRVRATADEDGLAVRIGIEQEPGASGKGMVRHYQQDVLPGYAVWPYPPSDSKAVRARPVASKCEAGMVALVRGPWLGLFLDELETFPTEKDQGHDDQVDALSGAFTMLEGGGSWRPM